MPNIKNNIYFCFCSIFLQILFIFNVCAWILCMYTRFIPAVLVEARRWHQSPSNWHNRCLCWVLDVWALETKPRSSVWTNVLNCWAISSHPASVPYWGPLRKYLSFSGFQFLHLRDGLVFQQFCSVLVHIITWIVSFLWILCFRLTWIIFLKLGRGVWFQPGYARWEGSGAGCRHWSSNVSECPARPLAFANLSDDSIQHSCLPAFVHEELFHNGESPSLPIASRVSSRGSRLRWWWPSFKL